MLLMKVPFFKGFVPSFLQFPMDFKTQNGICPACLGFPWGLAGTLAVGAHLGGAVPYPSAGRPPRCDGLCQFLQGCVFLLFFPLSLSLLATVTMILMTTMTVKIIKFANRIGIGKGFNYTL